MGGGPKLILHIGAEKTGTTSLQSMIEQNRALLLQANSVCVPDFLGHLNHRLAEYAFQDLGTQDYLDMQLGVFGNDQSKLKIKRQIQGLWRKRVEESQADVWLISSEHFQSRLHSVREVEALWSYLDSLYSSIRIVVYLRDPVATAYSSLSTAIRSGACPESFRLRPGFADDDNCHHQGFLSRWLSVVPRSHFEVRLFDQQAFVGHDLIVDFFDACGLTPPPGLKIPAVSNDALSLPAARLMSLVNARIPAYRDGRPNPVRSDLAKFVESYFEGMPACLPTLQDVAEFDDYYRDSIEFVRSSFFPGRQGRLWSLPRLEDGQPGAGAEGLGLHERQFADLLCRLWQEKQGEINRLQARLHAVGIDRPKTAAILPSLPGQGLRQRARSAIRSVLAVLCGVL